jgi:putative Mg2+ transporter-C (MgtC) family protein
VLEAVDEFLGYRTIGIVEVVARVGLAGFCGFALGLERHRKRKPMDFRAFMIVAVVSCVVAIMAQEIYADYASSDRTVKLDFMAIVSGVLTGIGFLGAGAILRGSEDRVIGTATGASIWGAGGIGLALGFGFYLLAAIAFLAIFGVLWLFGLIMPSVVGDRDDGRES